MKDPATDILYQVLYSDDWWGTENIDPKVVLLPVMYYEIVPNHFELVPFRCCTVNVSNKFATTKDGW